MITITYSFTSNQLVNANFFIGFVKKVTMTDICYKKWYANIQQHPKNFQIISIEF